jgi:hypothetical protein
MSQDQLDAARKMVKLFGILQYLLPTSLLAIAVFLPMILGLKGETSLWVTIGLSLVALFDFLFFRFTILPRAQKRLAELQ